MVPLFPQLKKEGRRERKKRKERDAGSGKHVDSWAEENGVTIIIIIIVIHHNHKRVTQKKARNLTEIVRTFVFPSFSFLHFFPPSSLGL